MTSIGEVISLPDGTSVRLSGHLDLLRNDGGVRPVRLPVASWDRFPPAAEIMRTVASQASGVRLSVRTDAPSLTLAVRCTRVDFSDDAGQPIEGPVNAVVATIDGLPVTRVRASVDQVEEVGPGGRVAVVRRHRLSSVLTLDGLGEGVKDVTIWLPQGMEVDLLGLQGGGSIVPAPASGRPVWLHHGSSISHCASPVDPLSSWPVVAAQAARHEVIYLGFSGQAMIDPFTADAIAATPADVISLSFGVNIVGARSMDERTFVPAVHGFLDAVRRGHPHTPIVLLSSILWPGSEDVPGPSRVDFAEDGSLSVRTCGNVDDIATGALTLATSRDHLQHVVRVRAAAGEPISYLDGRSLYGPDDVVNAPLPDGLHPDGPIYQRMGARFASMVFAPGGAFASDAPVSPTQES